MPRGAFAALNEQLEREGKALYANARNTTAGTVRQKDPAVTASAQAQPLDLPAGRRTRAGDSHSASLELLRRLGFPVNPNTRRRRWASTRSIAFTDEWADARKELDYETDGIVIKVDTPRGTDEARLRLARPALGDRVQVPGRAGDDEARGDRGLRRAHRGDDAGRARHTGRRRRHDGPQRHAPQHRRDPPQGSARRRHRRPAARRRRDPRGRERRRRRAGRERDDLGDAGHLPRVRDGGGAARRERSSSAVRIRTARRSASAGCSTSAAAVGSTSTASAARS